MDFKKNQNYKSVSSSETISFPKTHKNVDKIEKPHIR